MASIGSAFVSRWDTAVVEEVPKEPRDRLGIAAKLQSDGADSSTPPGTACSPASTPGINS